MRQLEQLQVQFELKKSEQDRMQSKINSSQAYVKALEDELSEIREDNRNL